MAQSCGGLAERILSLHTYHSIYLLVDHIGRGLVTMFIMSCLAKQLGKEGAGGKVFTWLEEGTGGGRLEQLHNRLVLT